MLDDCVWPAIGDSGGIQRPYRFKVPRNTFDSAPYVYAVTRFGEVTTQ